MSVWVIAMRRREDGREDADGRDDDHRRRRALANSGLARATRYTPALTIVAAWMRADTGVGPSIASGSQTWSGNWALLPIAPGEHEQRHDEQRDRVGVALRSSRISIDSRMLSVASPAAPVLTKMAMIPSANPTSPTRLTMNAFLAASAARPLAVPEPDEQVARQADQLPGHEHDQPVVRQDEQQHREHEQVEVGEEPPVARVVAHVADRVDVDEQADRRDDDEQAGRQRVDEDADVDVELAGRDPGRTGATT